VSQNKTRLKTIFLIRRYNNFYKGRFHQHFLDTFLHKQYEKLFWQMAFGKWQTNLAKSASLLEVCSLFVGEIDQWMFCTFCTSATFCLVNKFGEIDPNFLQNKCFTVYVVSFSTICSFASLPLSLPCCEVYYLFAEYVYLLAVSETFRTSENCSI